MDNLEFTARESLEFADRGAIEEWVHAFLTTVGRNPKFSDGLKLQRRYWLGPVLIDLDKMQRCCGSEPEMKFRQDEAGWEWRVGNFRRLIRENREMPPLIVEKANGTLTVSDGNARHEALRRESVGKCWAIIWGSDGPIDGV